MLKTGSETYLAYFYFFGDFSLSVSPVADERSGGDAVK
jgi:hypothetical protein